MRNLGDALGQLQQQGFAILGLDGEGGETLGAAVRAVGAGPVCLVLGAEGPGLRARTRTLCHRIARIDAARGFGSLNVSNAAAVALHALAEARGPVAGGSHATVRDVNSDTS